MIRSAVISAFVLGVCALRSSVAGAAPGDATRLEYARSEAAASCPDRTALKAAVRSRLGYDPFFPAARQTVVVEIIDSGRALVARMRLVDEQGMIVGSRELREKRGQCEELVAALSLAISIALDPSAALGPRPTETVKANPAESTETAEAASADPAPEAESKSVAQEHPQKTTEPRADRGQTSLLAQERLRLAARAALFADLGSAPALAFGYRAGLDLQRSRVRIAAEFSQQFPASKELSEGKRAHASLLAGTLAPCFASDTLAGCGLVSVGALRSRGENVENPQSQSTFYAALGARFEFTPLLFGKLRLLTQIDAMKPVTPISLRVAGAEVWQTPVLTFSAGLGLRLRFR